MHRFSSCAKVIVNVSCTFHFFSYRKRNAHVFFLHVFSSCTVVIVKSSWTHRARMAFFSHRKRNAHVFFQHVFSSCTVVIVKSSCTHRARMAFFSHLALIVHNLFFFSSETHRARFFSARFLIVHKPHRNLIVHSSCTFFFCTFSHRAQWSS